MKRVSERIDTLVSLRKSGDLVFKRQLSKALSDKSPTVRVFALEVVSEEYAQAALPYLLAMLEDSNAEVRFRAIENIGNLTLSEAEQNLLATFLKDKDELVRVATAETLGNMGDTAVLNSLRECLSDVSPLVRSYVAEAIGLLSAPGDTALLKNYLHAEFSDRAKVGFYSALLQLGDDTVLPAFLKLLASTDYQTRCATVNALATLNFSRPDLKKVILYLKKHLKKEPAMPVKETIRRTLQALASETT